MMYSNASLPSDGNLASADAATAGAIPWILRIGMAGCFIGHGAFGVITKAAWVPYFAVGGVGEAWAWRLMPWIGWMDITIGILALLRPSRALFMWAAVWTVWTALLRPLSGEPVWEFFERAGNFGVPVAILTVIGVSGPWFSRLPSLWNTLSHQARLTWILRLTTFTLLAGHAGLGLFAHKAGLARHYAALHLTNPAAVVPWVGVFEFLLAGLVLFRPRPTLLLAICLWKISTESLFLVSGSPIWELIERFGSYFAPLALALLLTHSHPVVIQERVLAA